MKLSTDAKLAKNMQPPFYVENVLRCLTIAIMITRYINMMYHHAAWSMGDTFTSIVGIPKPILNTVLVGVRWTILLIFEHVADCSVCLSVCFLSVPSVSLFFLSSVCQSVFVSSVCQSVFSVVAKRVSHVRKSAKPFTWLVRYTSKIVFTQY